MKGIRNKALALVLAAYMLAFSPFVKGQEARDPNLARKKYELSFAVKSLQGFGGEVFIPKPVPVGDISTNFDLKLPLLGKVNTGGYLWYLFNPWELNGEIDVGTYLSKEISDKFETGARLDIYSIKIGKKGKCYPNYNAFVRYSPLENFGFSFAADVRSIKKLSEYSISTSWRKPVTDVDSYKFRVRYTNSRYFGPNIQVDIVASAGNLYILFRLMKRFTAPKGSTEVPDLVGLVEIGFRLTGER